MPHRPVALESQWRPHNMSFFISEFLKKRVNWQLKYCRTSQRCHKCVTVTSHCQANFLVQFEIVQMYAAKIQSDASKSSHFSVLFYIGFCHLENANVVLREKLFWFEANQKKYNISKEKSASTFSTPDTRKFQHVMRLYWYARIMQAFLANLLEFGQTYSPQKRKIVLFCFINIVTIIFITIDSWTGFDCRMLVFRHKMSNNSPPKRIRIPAIFCTRLDSCMHPTTDVSAPAPWKTQDIIMKTKRMV